MLLDRFYRSIKVAEVRSNANLISSNIDSPDLPELLDSISKNSDTCIEILSKEGDSVISIDSVSDCVIHRMTSSGKQNLMLRAQENGGSYYRYISADERYGYPPKPKNSDSGTSSDSGEIEGNDMSANDESSYLNMLLNLSSDSSPNSNPLHESSSSTRSTSSGSEASESNSGDIIPKPQRNSPSQSLIFTQILDMKSGASVAVLINTVITPVNATVVTLRYQLIVITCIMILLAIVLAVIIASRISKPIEDINESAKLLALGRYDTKFHGCGYLEISELSDTLNTAAVELGKVESQRRELMANISHDLRTPLSLIYGYAEVMHDFPDEILPEQSQTIMDEAQRLTSLVNDVLDISRLENSDKQLNLAVFNLTTCLRVTARHLAELVKRDGYSLFFYFNQDVWVNADQTQIIQVFYNLLINAINHTGDDKKIVIRQIVSSSEVKIEVMDSGEGINTEDLPYIWDRYYKVDKQHKRSVTGTGLGLSIVKNIISLHDGECGVDTVLGEGSSFWFSLKLYAQDAALLG